MIILLEACLFRGGKLLILLFSACAKLETKYSNTLMHVNNDMTAAISVDYTNITTTILLLYYSKNNAVSCIIACELANNHVD